MVNSQYGAQLCIGYVIKTVFLVSDTEYRFRNNAKMARTGRYGGSELWQGTVIIENGDYIANADCLSFSMVAPLKFRNG